MKISSPPAGSKIDLVEASDSRVVMAIPPGGQHARSLGCFALTWLAFTVPVGVSYLCTACSGDVDWEGDDPAPGWAVVLFFAGFWSIFWSVGLVTGYTALKMKFESLMLCLEPGRLNMQRTFFGRKRMSAIQLQDNSRARLGVSYTQNDVPVYRLEIDGVSKKEKFGAALSLVEKRWLAQTINRFLGHEDSEDCDSQSGVDRFCSECGSQLLISEETRVCPDCGAVFHNDDECDNSAGISRKQLVQAPADVAPEDLSSTSGLVVEDDSGEQLVVSFLLNPSLPPRIFFGGMFLALSLTWFGVAGSMAWEAMTDAQHGNAVFAVFALIMACVGFGPLLIGLAVMFGRARVTTDREWLSVRYHFGPIGFTRKAATDSVRDVLLGQNSFAEVSGSPRNRMATRMVMVETTGKPLILKLGSQESISRNLCGVVRYQLHRLGFRLASD